MFCETNMKKYIHIRLEDIFFGLYGDKFMHETFIIFSFIYWCLLLFSNERCRDQPRLPIVRVEQPNTIQILYSHQDNCPRLEINWIFDKWWHKSQLAIVLAPKICWNDY
jgi:hypothetical protein